jgi:hypothetical protein
MTETPSISDAVQCSENTRKPIPICGLGPMIGSSRTSSVSRAKSQKQLLRDPGSPNFAQLLSVTRALLGQKDGAIKEAERAITLLPSGSDAVAGPKGEETLASVEVLVGEKDSAIVRLQRLLEIPYADCLTPALLRLQPLWDPLRGEPRFQQLCEQKQP